MKIYELYDLKSSYIQYNKKVPKFNYILIFLFLTLVIFIIIISGFTEKTEIIKSNGIFLSTNKTFIMSPVGGQIIGIHKENGDYVDKNELIIDLSTLQVDAQILALSSKIENLNSNIEEIEKMISVILEIDLIDINQNGNPFGKNMYYYHYENILEALNEVNKTKIDNSGNIVNKSEEELKSDRKKIINNYLIQFFGQKEQLINEKMDLKDKRKHMRKL